jgi:hypothetical protein
VKSGETSRSGRWQNGYWQVRIDLLTFVWDKIEEFWNAIFMVDRVDVFCEFVGGRPRMVC